MTTKNHKLYIFLSIYAFALLLFTTHSSPLFIFNGWNDVNIYFTIGKGLFNGYIPYVDLIDHKGIYIFLIYGIGWLFNQTGFLGIYLLQSVFLAISIIYVYHLAHLFIKRVEICFLVAALSPLPMLTYDNYGGSAEEFILPLLTASLYYFTLYYIKPEKHKAWNVIILGGLFAAIFLMKFNLVMYFGGFILVIIIELVCKKQYRNLGKYILLFSFGVFIIALPYLIYMFLTGSFKAFIDIYLIMNNSYAKETGLNIGLRLFRSLLEGAWEFRQYLIFDAFLLTGLIFVMLKTKLNYVLGYCSSFVLLLTSIYLSQAIIMYALIPLTVFLNMAIIAIGYILEKLLSERKFNNILLSLATFMIFLAIIFIRGSIWYPEFLFQRVPVQHKMAEIIWEYAKDENPTLLEVGKLDSGFYTASGIIPELPFFHTTNIGHDDFPQIRDSQKEAVRKGYFEFVILHTESKDEFPDNNYWNLNNYVKIASLHGAGARDDLWFHLYQRENLQ
ncbi:MAG: glycosyltransferase family 39 protein [Lachnospiraceae bacterium]|nr:glycosyltransferase family 39 protein [Lachnospiraceae bacterium]